MESETKTADSETKIRKLKARIRKLKPQIRKLRFGNCKRGVGTKTADSETNRQWTSGPRNKRARGFGNSASETKTRGFGNEHSETRTLEPSRSESLDAPGDKTT